MSESPIRAVCILGATATGKTRLAALVADRAEGEVVSVDSRQLYRRMDIGTGKDLHEYEVDGRRVPVQLIDIVDPGIEYNVFRFKQACIAAIRAIRGRGRLPILCGGSGLYLSAVLQDYRMPAAPPRPERRAQLRATSTEALIEQLRTHGPLHNTTDIRDRRRLIRAIEIAEADPTSGAPSIALDALVFGIRRERAELRRRITQRLEERLEQGMLEEVRGLLEDGVPAEQLIGYGLEYRYLTEQILGRLTPQQMFDGLNTAIHRFAKRQESWFRRMERQGVTIEWLEGSAPPEFNADRILERLRDR